MQGSLRPFMVVVGGVLAVLAFGFVVQWAPVTRLWPLPYTNATTYLFFGSILAAAVASILWCLGQREDGAFAGVFLDLVAISAPVAILTVQISARDPGFRTLQLVSSAAAIVGAILFLVTVRLPFRDPRPTPRPLRWAFAGFVIVLLIVGGQLVLGVRNVLPWSAPLTGQVIYGWMFLGAAAYFAYGFVRPRWQNAGGQLAGFLAYDLVLIVPFVLMLPDVRPDRLPNLVVYIAVLLVSGALAAYYLLVHPPTRLRWRAGPRR